MLGADGVTLSYMVGGTRTFDLRAGAEHANMPYWIWMGVSGTYPGIDVQGISIPMNYDMLVSLGWLYPGSVGTNFIGQLDGNGEATASLTTTPNFSLLGLTLYFSYVVLSPGGGLPALGASNPINLTFVFKP